MAGQKPSNRSSPKSRLSLKHNLEKEPLQSGRTEDESSLLHSLGRRSHWDIRHWSFPAVILLAVVLIIGLLALSELTSVRLISRVIENLP